MAMPSRTPRSEDAFGDERVYVRVEVDQIAEGLDEEDEAGAGAGQGGAERLRERSRDDAAELAEKRPTIGPFSARFRGSTARRAAV
jgi:hypothetical protein